MKLIISKQFSSSPFTLPVEASELTLCPMVGIIGGGSLRLFGDVKEELLIETREGVPSSPLRLVEIKGRTFAVLLRHGDEGTIPPHRINHRANIRALLSVGVEKIIGINSVGSLRLEIRPGSLMVPDDYFCPWDVRTFFDEGAVHITPALDEDLRKALIEAARKAGFEVIDGGIYVQTIGPRLETKAEVRFLSTLGHVVGMTMAHEATLCREMAIPYASLCTVDNYAHGLAGEPLSQAQIEEMAKRNAQKVMKVLEGFEG